MSVPKYKYKDLDIALLVANNATTSSSTSTSTANTSTNNQGYTGFPGSSTTENWNGAKPVELLFKSVGTDLATNRTARFTDFTTANTSNTAYPLSTYAPSFCNHINVITIGGGGGGGGGGPAFNTGNAIYPGSGGGGGSSGANKWITDIPYNSSNLSVIVGSGGRAGVGIPVNNVQGTALYQFNTSYMGGNGNKSYITNVSSTDASGGLGAQNGWSGAGYANGGIPGGGSVSAGGNSVSGASGGSSTVLNGGAGGAGGYLTTTNYYTNISGTSGTYGKGGAGGAGRNFNEYLSGGDNGTAGTSGFVRVYFIKKT